MKHSLITTLIPISLLFSSLLLLSVPVIAEPKANSQSPVIPCHLSMGLSEWLPYQSISDSGAPSGFQIDLLKQIAAEAGCELSYRSVKFSEGIESVAAGKLDVMMNATPSDERKEFANFSIPYRNEFMLLYSTPAWLQRCQTMSLRELIERGFRLAVQKDVVFGKELRDIQANPVLNRKLIYINNDSPHVGLVNQLNLDGIIDDPVVVAYLSTINNTGNSLSSCPIKISSSPVSFMFSKRSVSMDVIERFNQAIRAIQSTTEYKKRWNW
jgi:polar amino acid transport system substrate-binding protein